ncbi:Transposon Ty3-I Gag-Pol polyprotein [Vitis vinifera]|uniref:Transposon Ty3-I Gag-Pol polyprotein n=1 Tax=Vitis vinifera TaxID=29760 RepID=A0A438GVH4_VITVI|nr:Transposon Ty3-I Gag-Pol polyprotein [Vitis vinifera]
MDDLFRRANKYSMLEDDVRAATQQVLVAGRPARNNTEGSNKPPDRPKPSDRKQEGPSRPEMPPLTPLSISYEKILPMIQGLSDFRWPRPIGTDPSARDRSRRCAFHKNHGHTTETCRAFQFLVERLIKAGHLKQYLRTDTGVGTFPSTTTLEPLGSQLPPRPLSTILTEDHLTRSMTPGGKGRNCYGLHQYANALIPSGRFGRPGATSVVGHMGHSLAGLETPNESYPDSTDHQPHPWEISYCRSKLAQSLSMEFIPPLHLTGLTSFQLPEPIRQRIRRFHPDRQRVIRNEIDKLLEAGFIREVSYPDWLANVVVVPKKRGKWRVCVDYTNLNNACPKDSFPLPRIDQIVDSTSGQGMLSFLDAFSGYHQIPMSSDDEENTAFITPHDLYCYKVMPFGLKNAGATYQRLMTKIFKPLIGHSVEVYIDAIVVKSKTREQHILHLQEVFYLLRKYGMKLNPSKCAFGVSAGKFLGFMVSQRGIEVSPDQVKAVMETPPPRSKKELQRLTGKLVALGRFIARFTDELRPFFLAIRKAGAHGWTDSCQSALERIKHCLVQPPILSNPIPKEKLYMYLAVSEWAIQCRSIPLPLTQGAETYLLCQQGIGRRRNQIFKNGANSLSPSKCCSKAPTLFSSPPGDRVN